jgi:D-serine deaminase-like pyridoxal phosphate-dependent protein
VLVKVDVGFHRCGIDPQAAGAAEMVARVAELPGLRFRGLLSHAGHGYGGASDAEIQ